MSNVKEIEPKSLPIPEGYVGNLNDDQLKALVGMWQSYFDICDRARGKSKKGGGFKEETVGKDPKKSGIPDDDAAKDEVKKQQEQQGMNDLLETYGSEALRDSWWNFVKGDNPDGTMLKFVRARKGDVSRGVAMMATMLRWRLDNDVEGLVQRGDLVNAKEIPKFIEQQKSGKVFSAGCTGNEEPICYVIMKYHSVWGQPSASMQRFIITQMETFRLLMPPPVDKACIFFDLKGFGVKQMDVVSLLYLVKVLESYYPESLSKMYISNAPYIFWGFWRMVKNILDPVVRDKIVFITGPAETGDHVPSTRMIKYCGGEVESGFEFIDPKAGENDIQKDTTEAERLQDRHHRLTDQFEKVTRAWCEAGGNDEKLNEQRSVLIKKLRLSQFELEPYTRGLTAYHRNGVLPMKSPGIATFDYKIGSDVTRQVMGKKSCRKSVEQQLCDIADGSTVEEAEEKTSKSIEDGSWGQWRENDNSEEVKAKALATLDDLEGTGKLDIAAVKTSKGSSNSTSKPAESKKTKEIEAGAAGAGAAAAGAAAIKSKRSKKQPDPVSEDDDDDEIESDDRTAATQQSPPRKSSPPRARKSSPPTASNGDVPSKNSIIDSTKPTRNSAPNAYRHSSIIKHDSSNRGLNQGSRDKPRKKGFFDSLKFRIAA